MNDRQSETERQIATSNELDRSESHAPWMTWRDVPLLILFFPLAFLLGMHVAGLAMLIREYLRVPYFVTLTLLYALLLIPAWIWYETSIWILLIGTSLVLLASIIPLLLEGAEGAMDGSNIEQAAPAHIVLISVYLFVPVFNVAMEARSRLHEKPNNPMQPSGEVRHSPMDNISSPLSDSQCYSSRQVVDC